MDLAAQADAPDAGTRKLSTVYSLLSFTLIIKTIVVYDSVFGNSEMIASGEVKCLETRQSRSFDWFVL